MPRTKKPEQDQADQEIAAKQDAESASVTDSGPVPGQTEVFVGEMGETTEGLRVVGDSEAPTISLEEIEGDPIDLLAQALAELGEPDGSYPAPVVNAINLIVAAQAGLAAEGVEVVGTLERIEEIEEHNPGEIVPVSGLYRPLGSEAALSKGDRFPPPSPSRAWGLFEAAKQKGRG